jgi:hypothetical protein
MREIRKALRMKNLSNSVFIRKVFAILTSSILIYFTLKNMFSHSLEILSHEEYQEEIDASYITPRLRKMQFVEALEELGEKLNYKLKYHKDEKI